MHLRKNEAKQATVKLITQRQGVTLTNKLETVTPQSFPLRRTTTDEKQLLAHTVDLPVMGCFLKLVKRLLLCYFDSFVFFSSSRNTPSSPNQSEVSSITIYRNEAPCFAPSWGYFPATAHSVVRYPSHSVTSCPGFQFSI